MALEPDAARNVAWILAISSLVHVIMAIGESTIAHGTAHAKAAAHEMTRGRYGRYYQIGLVLVGIGILAPWWPLLAAPAALAGLLAYEPAFVQAGQSVPLA